MFMVFFHFNILNHTYVLIPYIFTESSIKYSSCLSAVYAVTHFDLIYRDQKCSIYQSCIIDYLCPIYYLLQKLFFVM